MDPFIAFGRSAILEQTEGRRFQLLEVLRPEAVSEHIDEGVQPCFDRRYARVIQALRSRHRIQMPRPGSLHRPRIGDQFILIWAEAPTRPFLVDHCEYDSDELEEADF